MELEDDILDKLGAAPPPPPPLTKKQKQAAKEVENETVKEEKKVKKEIILPPMLTFPEPKFHVQGKQAMWTPENFASHVSLATKVSLEDQVVLVILPNVLGNQTDRWISALRRQLGSTVPLQLFTSHIPKLNGKDMLRDYPRSLWGKVYLANDSRVSGSIR